MIGGYRIKWLLQLRKCPFFARRTNGSKCLLNYRAEVGQTRLGRSFMFYRSFLEIFNIF